MAALDQYTELFRHERPALDSHSPEVLRALRDRAIAFLDEAGRLPMKCDEGFEKTSVEEMFASDLGVNVNRVNIPVDVAASFRCGVPNISTLLGVVVNDRFVPSAALSANLPAGVTFCALSEAPSNMLPQWLGACAGPYNAGLAFNSLLLQDGVLIHVAAGVKVPKPLQIVNIFSSPAPLLAMRRIVVVAEQGSEVCVIKCDHTQTPDVKFGASEVVEILAREGSRVEWYDIEESTPGTARWSQLRIGQKAHSQVNVCTATLSNGVTRNEYYVDIDGEGCETRLAGCSIGGGSQHIDNNSYVTHRGDRGHSDQLFKYVLEDNATGAFEGCIEVAHGARFNEAYQSNRNILASEGARMHTKPQLLIYNDDVKCSHGAATGQLDESALFYMRQRGIPLAEARKMLMQAFMVDVVDRIEHETLRDRLRHMLELRFSGNCQTAGCARCHNA